MSNEKFTHGEWRINQRPNGKISIVGGNGQQVCLMWNSKQRNGNCDLITTAANASIKLKLMGYDPLKVLSAMPEIIGSIEQSCEINYLIGKDVESMKEQTND